MLTDVDAKDFLEDLIESKETDILALMISKEMIGQIPGSVDFFLDAFEKNMAELAQYYLEYSLNPISDITLDYAKAAVLLFPDIKVRQESAMVKIADVKQSGIMTLADAHILKIDRDNFIYNGQSLFLDNVKRHMGY